MGIIKFHRGISSFQSERLSQVASSTFIVESVALVSWMDNNFEICFKKNTFAFGDIDEPA